MKKRLALLFAIILSCQLFLAPLARAADGEQIGMWIGAGAIDILYLPGKAVFFLLMGLAGGLSAIVTVPMDEVEISSKIIKWGFYGDWLIRPDHLRGESSVEFIGLKEEIRFVWLQPSHGNQHDSIFHVSIPRLDKR